MLKAISITKLFNEEVHNQLFYYYEQESGVSEAPKAKPCFDTYKAMEDQGRLTISGLYADNTLVGFCVIAYVYLTHSSSLAAIIDGFSILHENRKFGGGRDLIKHAEQVAIDKGATVITMTSPVNSRLSKVADSFGYKTTNVIHSKKLV